MFIFRIVCKDALTVILQPTFKQKSSRRIITSKKLKPKSSKEEMFFSRSRSQHFTLVAEPPA
jgi:hypothetical protein